MSELREFWGLRALAVIIALLLWWVFSVEQRDDLSERVVQASVTFNTPGDLILLTPISEVAVRLRGPGNVIRTLNPFEVTTVIDIASDQIGTFDLRLEASDIEKPESIEVVSVEPAVLTLQTDKRAQALLPVEPVLIGEPAAGAIYSDPEVIPPLVYVTGPSAMLSRVKKLVTTEIDLTSHAITFEETVAIVPPSPLIRMLRENTVTVRIPMSIPGTQPGTEAEAEPDGATERNGVGR